MTSKTATGTTPKVIAGVLIALVILATVMTQQNPVASQSATPESPTANSTNLDPLDINSATLYQSDDFVIQIRLPAGWQHWHDVTDGFYIYQYNALGGRTMRLIIIVGTLQAVYNSLIPSSRAVVNSPQEFFGTIKRLYQNSVLSFTDIHPVKVGKWNGYGVQGQGPILDQDNGTQFDQRIALLSDGTALFVSMSANQIAWQKADMLFDNMLDSLVINTTLLLKPTPDLPSLYITATALQAQINSLLPTVSATDQATSTP